MSNEPLAKPVGALMRPADSLQPEDSLGAAAQWLREQSTDVLAIAKNGYLVGIVTERSLARCLADGMSPYDPLEAAMVQPEATLSPFATGAEALRVFAQTGGDTIPIVDEASRVLGLLSPSDLYPKRESQLRPPLIGGMATPFGVYLTTGTVRAGVGDLALVVTGALLFGLLAVSTFSAEWIARQLPASIALTAFDALTIVFFLLLMRVIPLSGIHAAEHKVVHAIERGEELQPNIVQRMPRVHPRCGTNLAVGASLFFGLGSATFLPSKELQLLLALIATLALWRPLGGVVQLLVTTRPPSPKHLQMGISAGKELLERYQQGTVTRPTFLKRIWCSGMLHVIGGSFLAYGLIWLATKALGLPMPV